MSGKIMQALLPDELGEELSVSVKRGERPSESDALAGAVDEWRERRSVEAVCVEELRRIVHEGVYSAPGELESFEEMRAPAHRRHQFSSCSRVRA